MHRNAGYRLHCSAYWNWKTLPAESAQMWNYGKFYNIAISLCQLLCRKLGQKSIETRTCCTNAYSMVGRANHVKYSSRPQVVCAKLFYAWLTSFHYAWWGNGMGVAELLQLDWSGRKSRMVFERLKSRPLSKSLPASAWQWWVARVVAKHHRVYACVVKKATHTHWSRWV